MYIAGFLDIQGWCIPLTWRCDGAPDCLPLDPPSEDHDDGGALVAAAAAANAPPARRASDEAPGLCSPNSRTQVVGPLHRL